MRRQPPLTPQQGLVPFALLSGLGLVSVHRGSSKRARHSPAQQLVHRALQWLYILAMGTWEMRGRAGTPMIPTATSKELEHCGLCLFVLEVTR